VLSEVEQRDDAVNFDT